MENIFYSEKYRGYNIELFYDEYPQNPREWDNVATLVCEHHGYTLGDKHDVEAEANNLLEEYVTDKDVVAYFKKTRKNVRMVKEDGRKYYAYDKRVCGEEYCTLYIDASDGTACTAEQMAEDLSVAEKLRLVSATGKVVIYPISMHEHTGVYIFLGDAIEYPDARWDCGLLGFAYIEYADAEKEDAVKPDDEGLCGGYASWQDWALDRMQSEVKLYNCYLSGRVYAYCVDGGEDGYCDVCCGYYGDNRMKDMIEEAKSLIDSHVEYVAQKRELDIAFLQYNMESIVGRMFCGGGSLYIISRDMFGKPFVQKAYITCGVVGDAVEIKVKELSDDMLDIMAEVAKQMCIEKVV